MQPATAIGMKPQVGIHLRIGIHRAILIHHFDGIWVPKTGAPLWVGVQTRPLSNAKARWLPPVKTTSPGTVLHHRPPLN